jgi:hypothetical protein
LLKFVVILTNCPERAAGRGFRPRSGKKRMEDDPPRGRL